MFRKLAVALIATSMLVAPALAAETMKTTTTKPTAPATVMAPKAETKAPVASKTATTVKVVKKHRIVRHKVLAGKHRKHVKHVVAKKKAATHIKTVKATTKVHRVVKTKKLRVKKEAAAVRMAPRTTIN